MKELLINYFNSISTLSAEEAKAIEESISTEAYAKGTMLLREGQIARAAYFILQGCVRQYYLVDGEECTDNFFTEGQWLVSIQSLTQQVPATHYWVCTEEVVLVVGNAQKEKALFQQFPRLESVSRLVVEKMLAEQQTLLADYRILSPEQRYLKLMQTRPELLQRVPQYQLASFIGVKPESLSRIRKRLAKQD